MKRAALFVSFFVLFSLTGFVPAQAEDGGASQDQPKKLDQILANQQQILESIEQIKQELKTIKVRATS